MSTQLTIKYFEQIPPRKNFEDSATFKCRGVASTNLVTTDLNPLTVDKTKYI